MLIEDRRDVAEHALLRKVRLSLQPVLGHLGDRAGRAPRGDLRAEPIGLPLNWISRMPVGGRRGNPVCPRLLGGVHELV